MLTTTLHGQYSWNIEISTGDEKNRLVLLISRIAQGENFSPDWVMIVQFIGHYHVR